MKKITYILFSFLLFFSILPNNSTLAANTTFKGTFVNAIYDETELKDGSVERKLSKITLKNSAGKTTTLNIDENAYFYINKTKTTIDGFKNGMEIEAKVNLRKVKELHGTSNALQQGSIVKNSKQKTGIVTKIDPNGMFITVKVDGSKETNYYINRNTKFRKSHSTVDLSALYEGDRVKLKFTNTTTSAISEVEIISTGIEIANLYKGQLQLFNSSTNKLTVMNAQPFENWLFGTMNNRKLSTFTLKGNTPIYAGSELITKNELKNYKESELYFVTKKEFSNEIVQKVIVLENNERTYFEPLTSVNTAYNFINLKTTGRMYFHEGSILVRNGRLVEPSTLTSYGEAFVVTDGGTRDNFAHIVNITNDAFNSPNLTTHGVYFGRISIVDNYLVEFDQVVKQENNYWKSAPDAILPFSNSTKLQFNNSSSTYEMPSKELIFHETEYGYFYVKDGHIDAIHLLEPTEARANLVLTGQINTVDIRNEKITVKDLSQWFNGSWLILEAGSQTYDLQQTLIIKNGNVIEPMDLKSFDRVVLYTDPSMDCHVLVVN